MKTPRSNLKKTLLVITIILLIGLALLILEKTKVTNFYQKPTQTTEDKTETTSDVPSAQADFTEGGEREPGYSVREDAGSGGVTDNNGVFDNEIDKSILLTSPSGEITLYSFKSDSTISSGKPVAGTSQLTEVSYRLMDNVTGVIASGKLRVINGQFSGKLEYTTSGSEGRLDIYGTKPDGTEFSNIEVPLRFK